MEMKKINAGKLRALGYDPKTRTMRVELEGALTLDYTNVPADTFRRFSTHASPWSFYRDNIEEEFHATRGRSTPKPTPADLAALFRDPDPET